MTLTEARARIGDSVIYQRHDGRADDGTIVSVTRQYVMVLYTGDRYPKATSPDVLTFPNGAHK